MILGVSLNVIVIAVGVFIIFTAGSKAYTFGHNIFDEEDDDEDYDDDEYEEEYDNHDDEDDYEDYSQRIDDRFSHPVQKSAKGNIYTSSSKNAIHNWSSALYTSNRLFEYQ